MTRILLFLSILMVSVIASIPGRTMDDPPLTKEQITAVQETFKKNCYSCHGLNGSNEGGFNFVMDRDRMIASRHVVPGQPMDSPVFKRMAKGNMPPAEETQRPKPEEIAALKKWIEAGAPGLEKPAPARRLISFEKIVMAVAEDLESARERDRRFLRYFTLTHLYNAGWSEDEMESYRIGLSKLVNSLSWGKKVVKPYFIDSNRTIYRIDLRNYRWSEKVWERILEAYPYGVTNDRIKQMKYCQDTTTSVMPIVRGDWFVAAASRPPLYHEVLELPDTDLELEKQLQLNIGENIRQERVARAGFNGSGISRHNRLIERHESTYGSYWKSYDFDGAAGKQNLFEYPLGPGDDGFQHAGGEVIFSLPNGLHAYLLVDGAGKRIDKGPLNIVSDPRQFDRSVVNGLSCMSCHHQGLLEKSDQVRLSVQKNPKAFPREEASTILALYPEKSVMEKYYKEDTARYVKALLEAGGRVDESDRVIGSDPVTNLALQFERELDLKLAAAEVGLTVDDFLKLLDRSPGLARAAGILKVQGGTLQRQAFIGLFSEFVRLSGVGVAIRESGRVITNETTRSPSTNNSTAGPNRRLFDQGALVYLADMTEFDLTPSGMPFKKNGTLPDNDRRNPNSTNRMRVNGRNAPKGIYMPSESGPNFSSVKYRLNKQAAVFKTIVAVDDTNDFCFTPAIFTVLGDGKELFKSGNVAHNHSRSLECNVNVSGVDVLELRVGCVGSNMGVTAVWVDPRILQRTTTTDTHIKKLFGDGPRMYLVDLDEFELKKGALPLGRGDVGNGKSLRVSQRLFPKGLGMHPPVHGGDYASAKYKLEKKAALFRGGVGIDDNSGHMFGKALFEIYGDGKQLWNSRAIGNERGVQEFSLNVSQIDVLELRVSAIGSGNNAHAAWLDARLLQKANTPDK